MSQHVDILEKLQKMLDGHDSDEICLTVDTIKVAIEEINFLRSELAEYKSLATDACYDSTASKQLTRKILDLVKGA